MKKELSTGNRLKIRHRTRNAREQPHGRERHQEGRQAQVGDEGAIDCTDGDTGTDAGRDPVHRRRFPHDHGGQEGRDRHDGSEGEIDLTRGQDEDQAHRHHRGRRRLQYDVGKIPRAEKAVVMQRQREERENCKESEVQNPFLGFPVRKPGLRVSHGPFTSVRPFVLSAMATRRLPPGMPVGSPQDRAWTRRESRARRSGRQAISSRPRERLPAPPDGATASSHPLRFPPKP